MTQYKTDFSEYGIGTSPSDWSAQWNNSNISRNMQTDSAGLGYADLAINQSGNEDKPLTWNQIPGVSDVEVLMRFKTSQMTGYQDTIYIRGTGSAAQKTCYYLAVYELNGAHYLEFEQYYTDGKYYNLASTAINQIALNQFYWMRVRAIGNNFLAKIWQDGTDEPDWMINYTDPYPMYINGWTGLGAYNQEGTKTYDYFAVGTNGDSAPYPPGYSLKTYNGSSWVRKQIKTWNGSAWVYKDISKFDGTNWVKV